MTQQEFIAAAERYKDSIFRLAFQYCKNAYDAEDIVQTVLLKLLSRAPAFESEAHRKNWLMKVTANDCKKLLRSPWRTRHEQLEDYAETLSAEDSFPDRTLFDAVMELPRPCRVATYLYYYEGYSVKEIAQITGSNPSTIRTRMQRARALLKDKLKEGWSDDQ